VGLAFKKFHTFRVNVDIIQREELRKQYRRTPSFRFFDPVGEPVGTLEGRRVTSLSAFTRYVEKVWKTSYTYSLKSYSKDMTRILDRLDKVGQMKTNLERDRARLAEKPNPRKQREADKDQAEIEKAEKAIAEDEAEIHAKVKLREEYLPKTGEEAAKAD
jgi:hypothetical protein